MAVFYTADTHFGHRNIIDYSNRPWADVDAMNDGLVTNINSVVSADDILWILGDVALSERSLAHVSRLNGRKILVAGNHDSCWAGHRRQGKAQRAVQVYLDAGFAEVHPGTVDHEIGGRPVLLSHLPYLGDSHHDDRYADRRPVNRGLPLVCGHVHEKWQRKEAPRMWNVGVDANGWLPVAEEVLAEWIRTGS